MTSRPLIECELSETEQEFVDWVDSQARTQLDDERATRYKAQVSGSDDDVLVERHTVEFFRRGPDGSEVAAGHIAHTMKRIEYRHGECWFIESRFELSGPDAPHAPHRDVEAAVKLRLDRIRATR